MASLGQLAAGVAHEINNLIGFILCNLGTLTKYNERLTKFIGIQSTAIETMGVNAKGSDVQKTVSTEPASLKIDIIAEIGDLISESVEGGARGKQIVMNLKRFSRVSTRLFTSQPTFLHDQRGRQRDWPRPLIGCLGKASKEGERMSHFVGDNFRMYLWMLTSGDVQFASKTGA